MGCSFSRFTDGASNGWQLRQDEKIDDLSSKATLATGQAKWHGDALKSTTHMALIKNEGVRFHESSDQKHSHRLPSIQNACYLVEPKGCLEIRRKPVPKPGPGQLLVEIKSSGIDPLDWKIQAFDNWDLKYPAILGTDISGRVVGAGEDAKTFRLGQRVAFQGEYLEDEAGFQQYALIPAELTGKIPARISDDQAATIPVGSMTSAVALFHEGQRAFPRDGPTVQSEPLLILGGSSSLGQYGIQLARLAGFSPIITTASLSNANLLHQLGATHVLDRHGSDLASEIRQIDPGLAFVYDTIGIEATQRLGLESIGEGTRNAKLVTSLPIDDKVKADAQARRHPVKVSMVFGAGRLHPHVAVPFWEKLEGWLEEGSYVPNRVQAVGGLESVQKGLDMVRQGVSATKIVVRP